MTARTLRTIAHASLAVVAAGCVHTRAVNPSFPLDRAAAKEAIGEMRESPVELARPVIVVGGYLDPGLGPWWTGRSFRKVTGDRRFLTTSFACCSTFGRCREKLIEAVDEAFPSADPLWTTEVDVIAISMGGLIARYAAAPPPSGEEDGDPATPRRLKIRRLFTMSSPHRGARFAAVPCFLELHRDMRAGSSFLDCLDEAFEERDYEVYPYVRLGDAIVGAENAAPEGRTAWWVSNPLFQFAHLGSVLDPRIVADIARRLRGEPHYAVLPAAPLPGTEDAKS